MSAEHPAPVEIIRPGTFWSDVVASTLSILLRTWVLMLTLGGLFPHAHVSFGQALLGVLAAGCLMPSSYAFWTRLRRRK